MLTYPIVSLGVKSFTPLGVGKAMQLLSREKNQNSPDRRGVAHALIKRTVHVSTITLLRGFAGSIECLTERFYTVSYRGCKPKLYNRAFGGVGQKWRRMHLRQAWELWGGEGATHTGECPWVIHTNTLLHIPSCVYPHSRSRLSVFPFDRTRTNTL